MHVSTKQVQWQNERLVWICLTQRALRDAEQRETLRLLREWLLNVAETQPGPARRTRLTGVFQNAALGIGERWPTHGLVQDPNDAIAQHLGKSLQEMVAKGAINQRQFDPIRAIVDFNANGGVPWVQRWDGKFNVAVELNNNAGAVRFQQAQMRLMNRLGNHPAQLAASMEQLSRHFLPADAARPLEQALQANLSQPAGDQRPLLSDEEAKTARVCLSLPTIAAAPFAGSAAKPNVMRGTAMRTRTTFVNQPLVETDVRDAFGNNLLDIGPQLVLDTQGCVGVGVNAVRFSPDGSWLVAVGDVVRIWDLHSSGSLAHTLRGCSVPRASGASTDIAFSAN